MLHRFFLSSGSQSNLRKSSRYSTDLQVYNADLQGRAGRAGACDKSFASGISAIGVLRPSIGSDVARVSRRDVPKKRFYYDEPAISL